MLPVGRFGGYELRRVDLAQFIAMAISELSGLHEGNLARYRLRPSEFRRWRGRRPGNLL